MNKKIKLLLIFLIAILTLFKSDGREIKANDLTSVVIENTCETEISDDKVLNELRTVTVVIEKNLDDYDSIPEFYTGGEERTCKGYVCLTFDDGPSKKYTQNILDLLSEYHAVATFFEVGYRVKSAPDLVKAEIEIGCEVENHSYNHINMKKSKRSTVLDEIKRCNEIIYDVTGIYPEFVRPPYGSLNKDALAECGLSCVTWSIDTRDWESRNKDKIMDVIYKEKNLNGQVILMHSTHEATVEALEVLLPYLRENGYKTVTLKELFDDVYEEEYETGKTYAYSYFIKRK